MKDKDGVKLGQVTKPPKEHECPIEKVDCLECVFVKEGLCDWPYDGSVADGHSD